MSCVGTSPKHNILQNHFRNPIDTAFPFRRCRLPGSPVS